MKVNIYIPHPALQELATSISTIEATLPDGVEEVVNPYPPTPFQTLLFYCNDPISMSVGDSEHFAKQPEIVLIGPQFTRVNIKVHKRLRAIRVDFFPGAMFRLLGIPMNEMFDLGFDAADFFGADMKDLEHRLQEVGNLEKGKELVEDFLLKKLYRLKEILPFDAAVKVLLANDGNMAIEEVASAACLSLKQFERKCRERLGMNPKAHARILRFSKAYRLREAKPDLNWTQIAYAAGYFDQMHMIRDFKVFAGVNPKVIEQQLIGTPLRMQKNL